MKRRELLEMMPLAGAGILLSSSGRDWLLAHGLELTDRASAALFSPTKLAHSYRDAEVTPLDRFPLNSYIADDPGVDLATWQLAVTGRVAKPGHYSIDAIRALPRATQNTRHICIEGWDVIGNFSGALVSDFLAAIGADPSARFIEVGCADDYYESVDMASVRHPQSLLCYEMYGKPLTREHGAPLRLVMPTKLGYKQAKYIMSINVTDVLGARRGYWEDQGYGWHGGL